jgi:hypothetical protein
MSLLISILMAISALFGAHSANSAVPTSGVVHPDIGGGPVGRHASAKPNIGGGPVG